MKDKSKQLLYVAILSLQLIYVFYFYLENARPYFHELIVGNTQVISKLQIADTGTYLLHAMETATQDIPLNIYGPVLLYKTFSANFDYAFVFLISSLFIAFHELSKLKVVPIIPFIVIYFSIPLVGGQIYAINKEILMIISLIFISTHIFSDKRRHLAFAWIFAFFSKIEFFLMIVAFILSRKMDPRYRKYILLGLIFLISIFYSNMPNMDSYETILYRGQNEDSFGITILMHELSISYHLFFLVIIPRILLLIYEGGLLHSFLFVLTLLALLRRTELSLRDDIQYLCALFLVLVVVVPFPHFRYILPIWPILWILALKKQNSLLITKVKLDRKLQLQN